MADILDAQASILKGSIERMRRLHPELDDDADLLADMVEGSTNFDTLMDRLAVAFLEKAALKDANAQVQKTLRERGERIDRRAEGLRALMMDLMVVSGKRKVELPTATLSIAKGRKQLELDDDFNAQGYMRVKSEPARGDILAALNAGDELPGARLVDQPEHLAIRTV